MRLSQVSEVLRISDSQTYALVRSGELKGIQIGGRNQWRVERSKLEECQGTLGSAHPRPRDLPAGGQDSCPVGGVVGRWWIGRRSI